MTVAAEGTFTSADIETARTDLRGECTCEFTPVGPGTYVLPVIDWDCPVHNQARADALADFAAACERTVAPGQCTGCEENAAELIPWSGEKLCWHCVDVQLDLMAAAILEEGAVSVGGAGLR